MSTSPQEASGYAQVSEWTETVHRWTMDPDQADFATYLAGECRERIFREGRLPDCDEARALARLARFTREDGMRTDQEALAIVRSDYSYPLGKNS
jgi:hypothetical protein